ncbi:MAG: hypothetical protein QOG63_1879 [Thermoleophilaceae bacterium]|nr:hypothetical protein [Thermoleophilaceae bacterium]
MRLPIRARLTAWYVALLAAILIGLGAFVVLQLRADLRADSDRRITAAADETAKAFAGEGVKNFHDIGASVLHGDAVAQIIDAHGNIIAGEGDDLADAPGPVADRRATAAAIAGGSRRLDVDVDGPFRAYVRPVDRQGQRFALVAAESLDPVNRSVHRLLVLLLIGGPAALLVTAAGGWWLARAALRPVERMSAAAASIGADDLHRRLDLPRSDDEVARLGRTLNAMLDRLERGVDDKRRLIADASHELRGPLAVMRAELDVALGDPDLDPPAQRALESTREEADRLARMVDDMLTLAQVDEGHLELVTEPVDLRELAEHVAARFGPAVRVEGSGEVQADRLRVEQAVSNLVDNAVKYGGGLITVEAWDGGLAVTDSGEGIPPAERERIFDRFVRLDAARGRGGSGLGLAICAEVARAHGGRAWMEPANGGGSRFVLTLPAVGGGHRAADRRLPTAS